MEKSCVPLMQFQSTLPRGERHKLSFADFLRFFISIHAPTRGATEHRAKKVRTRIFQSTLPRGERQHTVFETLQATISIHAPTRGATAQCSISRRVSRVFQSTLPRGERHMVLFVKRTTHRDFNPRSHEGSDSNFI